MGQLTIHVHYTTFVVTEKQSQLGMAVNSGVLCTLNARNEWSQHRVHDKQTATLLHATLHYTDLPACVQRTPLLANKQTQCNICWCTHQQAEHTHTHTIFTSLSFPLYSVHEPYLLHFYCIQRASQIYISHTSHRGWCTSLVGDNMGTNCR